MPLPGTYTKVTLNFFNSGDDGSANCVLWYLISAGAAPTLSTVVTFANSFKTAFATAVPGSLPTGVSLNVVRLKYVSGGLEVEGDNNNGTIGGTVSSDPLPEEDVAVIQRRTGKVGRSKRGRIFWPYVPETFSVAGELQTAGLAAYAALAAMIKSDVVSGATTFKPQTPDWKNGILEPVVQAGYLTATGSRRDRRYPKKMTAVHV